MRWRQVVWCVLLSLAAIAPALAADAGLQGYVPGGARVVIGLRLRGLVDALAAKGFTKEAQDALARTMPSSQLGGIDIFHDLDEVWLASTGVGQNPPFLAIMTGRFNERVFSAGGKRYRNALIAESNQNAKQAMAFVDDGTLLAGDLVLVKAALDRGPSTQIDPALAARVNTLRGKYDIWGAGNPVPGPKPATGQDPLGSMDRFDFGMAFTNGLELEADLHVRSPEDLEKLSSTLKMIELALSAQSADPNGGHIELRTENGGIHVAFSIPEEALKKAIAAQRGAIASAVAAQLAQRGAAATAPAPASASTPAAASPATTARPARSRSTVDPVDEMQVVKNSRGDTVMVTLPAKE